MGQRQGCLNKAVLYFILVRTGEPLKKTSFESLYPRPKIITCVQIIFLGFVYTIKVILVFIQQLVPVHKSSNVNQLNHSINWFVQKNRFIERNNWLLWVSLNYSFKTLILSFYISFLSVKMASEDFGININWYLSQNKRLYIIPYISLSYLALLWVASCNEFLEAVSVCLTNEFWC